MSEIEAEVSPQTEQQEKQELTHEQSVALAVVQEICSASEQDLSARVQESNPPYFLIELEGEAAVSIWGANGKGLDALQHLVNAIFSRRIRSDVRILLDADGYRARRADFLRNYALSLAAEVKERNEEAELESLPPHERRIIHSVLAEDPDIRTYSEGEEPDRKVIISPRSL